MYRFQKAAIPDDPEAKAHIAESLFKYGVSIQQYENAYNMDDVTMYVHFEMGSLDPH